MVQWYGIDQFDRCDLPSPVHDQPQYIDYLDQLRANITSLAKDLKQRLSIPDAALVN